MKGSLPKRYARALIQLAREENKIETYGSELQNLLRSLQKSKGALEMLDNDSFDFFERLAAMEEIALRSEVQPNLKNFLLILVKKNRVSLFPEIVKEYQQFQDEFLDILRATVRSPDFPDEALLKHIEKILNKKIGKKVIAHGEAKPEMMGGLIVEVNHVIFDGSIKRKLERIQEAMLR